MCKLKHLPIDSLLTGLLKKHNATKNTVSCAKDITSQLNIHFDFDHAKHVLSYDLIDGICFTRVFPDAKPLHLQNSEDRKIIYNYSIIFLEAEHYELMKKLPISLFINIASMQEMDMPVMQKYFEYMRTSTVESYFYCCNREEKTMPYGSIIRFADYPWGEGKYYA